MAEVYPLSQEPETPEPKLPSPPYGPQVIVGGRYVEDQELAGFGLMGCLLGVGVGLIPTVLGFAKDAFASRFLRIIGPLYWVMLYTGLFRSMRHAASHFHNYGWGAEGEDLMVEQIRRLLDHRWTIFCNVQLREGRDDVDTDIVLVGSGGVYAGEVKRPRQDTRCDSFTNGQWQRKTKDGWKKTRNYGKQARDQATKLTKFLEQHGVTYSVQPVVALATNLSPSNFTSCITTVWLPANLPEHMANLRAMQALSEQDVLRITRLFKDVVAQQQRVMIDARNQIRMKRLRKILLPNQPW